MKTAIVSAVVVCVLCARTTADAQPVARLTYSLASEVSLHEPILAEVTFANASDQPVEVDFGWNEIGNFACRLSRSGDASAWLKPKRPPGLVALGKIIIRPMEARTHTMVLSGWCNFPAEGAYDLNIRFDGTVQGTGGRAIPVNRDSEYAITVLPRDEARLRARLQLLLQAALQAPLGAGGAAAATALASCHDPAAVSYLVRLADDKRFATTAIQGLAKISGDEAKRALEDLARSNDPEIAVTARAALAGLLR